MCRPRLHTEPFTGIDAHAGQGERSMTRSTTVCLAAVVALVLVVTATAADYPLAGTQPSMRPAGAPHITATDHAGAWYAAALHGVTRPYPFSLRFLEDQGSWHTPFNHPGMPGRYDIRGWQQR